MNITKNLESVRALINDVRGLSTAHKNVVWKRDENIRDTWVYLNNIYLSHLFTTHLKVLNLDIY